MSEIETREPAPRITTERLREMIGAGVPCVPANGAETASLVHEVLAKRGTGVATAGTSRPIEDRLAEALRRWRHGEMRPLWADMAEGPRKEDARRLAASLIDFMRRCGLEVKVRGE